MNSSAQHRIWFQGATDRVHMAPYISKVEAHLKSILEPDFSPTFHTTTPPATTTHAVTEYRIGRNLIKNAVVCFSTQDVVRNANGPETRNWQVR